MSDSILYRHKIDNLCLGLKSIEEISHFSIAMIFRDGSKYFLSNLYLWAVPYHTEGYLRGDIDHSAEFYRGKEFFIQGARKYDDMQLPIIQVLKTRYHLHTTFAMVRECADCDFIIETYHENQVADPEKLYHRVKDRFEDFIIHFFDGMNDEIKQANPQHSFLRIFNECEYRSDVIKRKIKDITPPSLTAREIQCLHLSSMGMNAGEIAEELFISKETVTTHLKKIRSKWSCKTIVQAAVMARKFHILS